MTPDITHDGTGRALTARELDILHGRTTLPPEKREAYIRLWQNIPQPGAAGTIPLPLAPPCPHRGPETGETTTCAACTGRHEIRLRTCSAFGSCHTTIYETPLARRCRECEIPPLERDYPPVGKKHLLFHVYPRHGGAWRRVVNAVRERIGLFDGRRVVAVAHDGTTEHPVMVEDALAGCGCEFVRVPNDPNLREVATFEALFGRVADVPPDDIILYSHAKGVTRDPDSTAHRWADVLTEVCLDYPDHVEGVLRKHPVAGPFLKVGRGWPADSKSTWHYSGSWYWLRAGELFGKPDWKTIDRFWSGIEPYPSLHFHVAEAGELFHRGRVPTLDLYSPAYWEQTVEPALREFRATHARRPPTAPTRALLPESAFANVFEPLAGKKVGYVPTPGNAGDHLIEAATFQLFARFGVRWVVGIDPSADVLVVPGGGSMGFAEYGLCRDERLKALAAGPPVWVFPQSFRGPDPEVDAGRYAKVFARDPVSLTFAGPGAELAPDLALGLDAGPFPDATEGPGIYLRADIEGVFRDHPSAGDPVALCAGKENPGWAYLELAARHDSITTDRLHFAVAGLIAGRHITLLPNSYHKNRAVWECWLKGLGCHWGGPPE